MEDTGIYYLGVHNKAENTFRFNNHLVEFLSVDEPQKIRGRKRDIAFLNEANELTLEDFRQINMRCKDMVILDFNPSDPIHWIYNDLIPREDADTWITTYRDNKFLSDDLVNEIERMKDRDQDYWRVYGEGLQAIFSARQVYSNWNFLDRKDFPDFDIDNDGIIGLDFGFSNDVSSCNIVFKKKDDLYIHEIFYQTGLTNNDIYDKLVQMGYDNCLLYYDSAEPKSGEELRRLGIMAKPSIKGQGSVNAGISKLKEFNIYVSNESKNIINEYYNYYWETLKDGTIINKPKHDYSHSMDAIRYAVYSHYRVDQNFFVI